MRDEWFKLREKLLFKAPVSTFALECGTVWKSYSEEYIRAKAERKEEIANILSEIAIDMQSYIVRWHLQACENEEFVNNSMIQEEVEKIYALLISWNESHKVDYIKSEVESIQKSSLMKLSLMADKNVINNRWGNDGALGLTKAIRRGAVLATTNPVMVNNVRKAEPLEWNKVKEDLKKEFPDADGDKLVQYFTLKVVLKNARELRPIYEATKGKYGYVHLQVNPKNSEDSIKMAEEVEFLYSLLSKELKGVPNVIFKIPGTKAAFSTVERLTGQGIGVTITACASFGQIAKFAEIIEKGNAKASFIVMMAGRFDDPVRDELEMYGIEEAASLAKHASTTVIRKSYDILFRQRRFTKSIFLIASLRGPWNIEGAITSEDTPIYITAFPDKADEYDSAERDIVSRINDKTPQEIIEKLMKSKIFKQGYEQDGLTHDEFSLFYPIDATLKSFSQNYEETLQYILSND